MSTSPNFSQLSPLYANVSGQYVELLHVVKKQFEDIAQGCQAACHSGNDEAFGKLRHKALGFLRLIGYKPLLEEFDRVQLLLKSGKSGQSEALDALFSELQEAIASEITRYTKV